MNNGFIDLIKHVYSNGRKEKLVFDRNCKTISKTNNITNEMISRFYRNKLIKQVEKHKRCDNDFMLSLILIIISFTLVFMLYYSIHRIETSHE